MGLGDAVASAGPYAMQLAPGEPYQKGKTNLDFTKARDSEWQWHQLGHMKVCFYLRTPNNLKRLIIYTLHQ